MTSDHLLSPQPSVRVRANAQVSYRRAPPGEHRAHRRIPARCCYVRRRREQIRTPPAQIQIVWRGQHPAR